MEFEFTPFPKMARLSREIVVTEKIDGTNAQVVITKANPDSSHPHQLDIWFDEKEQAYLTMLAGSRTRWISPHDDNFGFAAWVQDNSDELRRLGIGRHFGEWWGAGIQRRYGLDHKRFSLFNVARWSDDEVRPACCHVVPTLYRGAFDTAAIDGTLDKLARYGSVCAPGFAAPEGIIVFHTAAGIGFKKTIHDDSVPKSLA